MAQPPLRISYPSCTNRALLQAYRVPLGHTLRPCIFGGQALPVPRLVQSLALLNSTAAERAQGDQRGIWELGIKWHCIPFVLAGTGFPFSVLAEDRDASTMVSTGLDGGDGATTLSPAAETSVPFDSGDIVVKALFLFATVSLAIVTIGVRIL